MSYFRVTTRFVVKAEFEHTVRQSVENLLRSLLDEDTFQDVEVGDIDEVRQTWERL